MNEGRERFEFKFAAKGTVRSTKLSVKGKVRVTNLDRLKWKRRRIWSIVCNEEKCCDEEFARRWRRERYVEDEEVATKNLIDWICSTVNRRVLGIWVRKIVEYESEKWRPKKIFLKQNLTGITKVPPCLLTSVIPNIRSGIFSNELSINFSLQVFLLTEVKSLPNCLSLRLYQYLKWNPSTKCHIYSSMFM
jgi:hypothetical protein